MTATRFVSRSLVARFQYYGLDSSALSSMALYGPCRLRSLWCPRAVAWIPVDFAPFQVLELYGLWVSMLDASASVRAQASPIKCLWLPHRGTLRSQAISRPFPGHSKAVIAHTLLVCSFSVLPLPQTVPRPIAHNPGSRPYINAVQRSTRCRIQFVVQFACWPIDCMLEPANA